MSNPPNGIPEEVGERGANQLPGMGHARKGRKIHFTIIHVPVWPTFWPTGYRSKVAFYWLCERGVSKFD